jgi:outer membrane protein, adhesin transport system
VSNKKTALNYIFPAFFGLASLPNTCLYAQTLQDAVAEAIRSNPKILAANEEQKSFEYRTKQAFAGYLPSINMTAAHGEEWTNSPATRGSGVGEINLARSEMGVTISQMIFDGLNTKYKIEQAEAKQLSNKGKLLETEETLTMTVVNAYLDALMETELLELQGQSVILHEEILSKVKEMTKIGAGSEVDVRQAESRFALVVSEREAAIGRKLSAQTRYLHAVGSKNEGLTRPILKENLLPTSLEQAMQIGLQNHPSMKTAKADLEVAIAENKITLSNFLPSISLELGASNTGNSGGTKSYTKSASAMLELSYNIFNGGSDIAKRRETIKNINQSSEKAEEAQRNIKESVTTAWHMIETSRKRTRHIEKHVSVSKGVTQSYHDQFAMGSRSLLEVLDSESELHTAKKSLITEQFQFMRGTLQLLSDMGVLLDTLTLPTKEVMQSVASKADMLKANSLILSPLVKEEDMPPLDAMIPDGPEPPKVNQKPEATPPPSSEPEENSSTENREDSGKSSVPNLLEHLELIPEDDDLENSAPTMDDYLNQIPEKLRKEVDKKLRDETNKSTKTADNKGKDPVQELSILDYLAIMESPFVTRRLPSGKENPG